MSRRWLGVALAVTAPVLALCPIAPSAAASPPAGVSVFLTDLGAKTYLARQPAVTWQTGQPPSGPTITVDTSRQYQRSLASVRRSPTPPPGWSAPDSAASSATR